MQKRRLSRPSSVAVVALTCGLLLAASPVAWRPVGESHAASAQEVSASAREEAYRANNLGVALLEQFKHKEGAEQFERALRLDPQLPLAHVNLAIALYNVPDADAAAREAANALTLAPDSPQALYILALVARSRNQTDEAVAAFRRVLAVDPLDAGANVNLAQLYAQQRKYDEAAKAFRAALDAEPYNTTALYGLATVLLRNNQRGEGQSLLQKFQALRQSGAGTSIGTNYLEQGRYAEAVTSTGAESDLVEQRTPAVAFTDATATVLPAATRPTQRAYPPGLSEAVIKQVLATVLGGGATFFDFDGDGDLDLFDLAPSGQRLYRNDGGKFVDVSARAGALAANTGGGVGAVAGDYDNDGKADLFVLRGGGVALYHNDGAGKFSDSTAAAGIAPYPYLSVSAAFADVDHDGDLDIFVAGYADLSKVKVGSLLGADFGKQSSDKKVTDGLPPAPNRLLRNDGNGKFTDITAAAKVSGESDRAVAVVPTDYDNRRDVDLLVVNYSNSPALYRNMRDGTFQDVAAEVGLRLKSPATSAAAGDLNKDGYTDFYFGELNGAGEFALSDGRGRFVMQPDAGAAVDTKNAPGGDSRAAQFLDYDNDGLLDFVSVFAGRTASGLSLWRSVGREWRDVSASALPRRLTNGAGASGEKLSPRVLASGDTDGDGDVDLLVRGAGGALKFLRNDGGNRNRSVSVRLAGKVSNRSGVEAKVEMRAGSLRQKLEVYAASPAPAPADLVFGLGRRERADAVRVLWPSGTVQAETDFTAAGVVGERGGGAKSATSAASLVVTELDRKPSSCPFLYAWNGERFEFITDFMGGGEMGDWVAPGTFNTPDPDEYVRIRGDQLKERDGRYELRVTNELEEVLFVDRLQLVAVAHPAGVEVFPGEGLGSPLAAEFQLYATRDARPPAAATDEHGHDVLARIAALDRRYPDDFKLEPVRGYAAEHALTLDLGQRANAKGRSADERTLLLLTGWTDYAFSSDNVAAAHARKSLSPPALEVRDTRGRWQTVVENIGIPVGRPQTVVVDLTGKFLSRSREVRIVTNMRVYWDRILVDSSGGEFPSTLTRLEPVRADLRWRGFSAEVSPDGREPYGYDYARVSLVSPWKVFAGRYTREGDVRELLRGVDDMFVVSRPGDELSLAFDAASLPPLPEGWTRTFLLYADGFSKEMDINSASPEEVAPLPFHGMRAYPCKWPETFPPSQQHLDYVERYNTRVVRAPLPEIGTMK
ncbi:MAG TPA: FG-GAP-like repeat-containing protein [Pyrinomonadaceae bacterium]|nr:FG-GAP-like repeat-containing protein [Pyrinomonadaceae bacterium]